jgi:uncharacterized protein YqiB (DUF1249 family)
MQKCPSKKSLINTTPLYEENYQRLKASFPGIHRLDFAEAVNADESLSLRFRVTERFKYTNTILLSLGPTQELACLPRCELLLRFYGDARVVEVVSFQGQRGLLPHYEYPNDKMFHRDEKRQVNELLRDVLIYCQRTRFKLVECVSID